MKMLYELKDRLFKELEEISMQEEMTDTSLDIIDKLSHSIKSIETIIAMHEPYRYSYKSYTSDIETKRDNSELKSKLENIYQYTQDEQSRSMIQKWIKEL